MMQNVRCLERIEPQRRPGYYDPWGLGRTHLLPLAVEFLMLSRIDLRLLLTDRVVEFGRESIDVSIRIGALPASR